MTAVCFTGAGKHGDIAVTRDEWEKMARDMGWHVVANAARCDILVASRTGTKKDIDARNRGAKIWDYADFLHEYARILGHPDTNTAAAERERLAEEARQRIIEKKRAAREKAEREQAELDAMVENNPLWGSF